MEIPAGEFVFQARAAGPSDGRLVLLLHGFPQSSYEWRHQLAALGDAGYRAVAPDQRGYSPGARPEEVELYALEHLVADVLAMADGMGGHQFDLVGHDWGGAVAWGVASRYPTRIRTLTVVSTPHPLALSAAIASGGEQATRSSYFEFLRQPEVPERTLLDGDAAGLRAMFTSSVLTEDAVDEYVRTLQDPGAMTAALNWYRAMTGASLGPVGEIEVPAMYVWSTDDVALGREAAEATAGYVKGPYRFEVLEGVSHWIPEHAPDALTALLLDHLATHA